MYMFHSYTAGLLAVIIFFFLGIIGNHTVSAAENTLEKVRQKGYVTCGVGDHDFGFAMRNTSGEWQGFDIDFCRAIATATLGSPNKARFIAVDSQSRLPALINAEIDVLLRTTTWTLTRDVSLPINFTLINLYEAQGIIARKSLNITQLREAKDSTICVNAGTTSHHNLLDYLKQHDIALKILVLETQEGRWNAFFDGRCDLMSSDQMDLHAGVKILAPSAEEITFLSDTISKEPLSPAVRHGDDQWFDIVKWVVNATIALEELAISSKTIDQPGTDTARNEEARRMIGPAASLGKQLGLDDDWIRRIAHDVGNYGEIFERNLGTDSPYKMARNLNRLWTDGGLLYALPFR